MTPAFFTKATVYDPPSGWMYGFPKQYKPRDANEPLEETLVRDGYPALDAEFAAQHCRFWEVHGEENNKP